jgi:hypothetical protein
VEEASIKASKGKSIQKTFLILGKKINMDE